MSPVEDVEEVMSKFALPIKSTYVSDWGMWEAVREIIQNAVDEELMRRAPMQLRYMNGVLTVFNQGSTMTTEALLLGHTTKRGVAGARGQFGEGLNLALLAAVRAGASISVKIGDQLWVPSLEPAPDFGGHTVLWIETLLSKDYVDGVEIKLDLMPEQWDSFRRRFLFLRSSDESIVHVEGGKVLLDPKDKGDIYVKGIWVERRQGFEFGYDVENVTTDRDRKMISAFDLEWETSRMLGSLVAKDPVKHVDQFYGMLMSNAPDTHYVHSHSNAKATVAAVASHFRSKHGEKAVPVQTVAESQALHHMGLTGVVVPQSLQRVLEVTFGTLDDIKKAATLKETTLLSWDDLTSKEQTDYTAMMRVIDAALPDDPPISSRVKIVSYPASVETMGRFDGKTGTIEVAHKLLEDPRLLMVTIIHEEAHRRSGSTDGSVPFEHMLQLLWCDIVFAIMHRVVVAEIAVPSNFSGTLQ